MAESPQKIAPTKHILKVTERTMICLVEGGDVICIESSLLNTILLIFNIRPQIYQKVNYQAKQQAQNAIRSRCSMCYFS